VSTRDDMGDDERLESGDEAGVRRFKAEFAVLDVGTGAEGFHPDFAALEFDAGAGNMDGNLEFDGGHACCAESVLNADADECDLNVGLADLGDLGEENVDEAVVGTEPNAGMANAVNDAEAEGTRRAGPGAPKPRPPTLVARSTAPGWSNVGVGVRINGEVELAPGARRAGPGEPNDAQKESAEADPVAAGGDLVSGLDGDIDPK
jgi:hypothetical protein